MGNFERLIALDIADGKNGISSRPGARVRTLLHHLVSRANKEGQTFTSLQTIHEEGGPSTDTLERAAQELKALGSLGLKYDKGPRSGEIWVLACEAKRYVDHRRCDTWYFETIPQVGRQQTPKQQEDESRMQITALLDRLPLQESRELITSLYRSYGIGIDALRRDAQHPAPCGVTPRKHPPDTPHPAGSNPAPCGAKHLSVASAQKHLSEAGGRASPGPKVSESREEGPDKSEEDPASDPYRERVGARFFRKGAGHG